MHGEAAGWTADVCVYQRLSSAVQRSPGPCDRARWVDTVISVMASDSLMSTYTAFCAKLERTSDDSAPRRSSRS